jgi:hypothetical protein
MAQRGRSRGDSPVIALDADDRGTRLTLRHSGEEDEHTVRGTTEGWTHKLAHLVKVIGAASKSVADKGDNDD